MNEPYFPEVFDSSMVATLKQCPTLFKNIYLNHWKTKGLSIHLGAGGAYAKGVETVRSKFYIESATAEDALAWGVHDLLIAYGMLECPEDSGKTWDNMAGALVYYFDMYPLNHDSGYPIILPGNKRAIEFNYSSPLAINHPVTGHPILYTGRSDAITHFAGDNFVTDEKTTSQLGPTWGSKWALRGQFHGYPWLAREHGIRVAGVLVRGIAIRKTGFDVAESINYFADWQIDRWYVELLDWIADAISWWKNNRFRHNLDESCTSYGGCGFASACQSQNEEKWLESYFERRRWDPLTRTETKL